MNDKIIIIRIKAEVSDEEAQRITEGITAKFKPTRLYPIIIFGEDDKIEFTVIG